MPAFRDPVERFWERVSPEPNSGCWLWTGNGTDFGYGYFTIRQKCVYAHRFSYELHKGPIPGGHQVDHLCSNPYCVNPDHLEPVTPHENRLRTARRGRAKNHHSYKTHCPEGHELAGDNLYVAPKGGARHCRTCRRQQAADYRDRLAA